MNYKKYILPLMLIFVLLFVSIGECAWLANYTKRIKLTTDNTKVDAALSNFPTTVFFTSTQGEEIFSEFDADSDFNKCAFTTSNGTTQLYAEKELFDHSEQKAIYHVKVTSISSSAGTDIYYYYNNSGSNNTTYIGVAAPKQYPPAHSDTYVKSTTKKDTNYWAYFATDPALSLTGNWFVNSWRSADGSITNQRFHIDLGSAKIIRRIYYENSHSTGTETDTGVQNFTFWGSNTGAGSFDDLVYANDEGWTQLTISQSTFDQHTSSDVADPKYITVTNDTAYRYYAFKFADNYGDANFMGVRHIELWISGNPSNVWDSNFKAVYHMADLTTSTVSDSTSNDEDGTKKAANEPIVTTSGKVASGQDFDGTDDYINRTTSNLTPATGTFEMLFNTDNVADDKRMFSEIGGGGYFNFLLTGTDNKFKMRVHDGTAFGEYEEAVSISTWYHALVAFDTSEARFYINGVLKHTDASFNGLSTDGTGIKFGCDRSNGRPYDGKLDEARVSNAARSTAWAKATYNTLFDSLLTYGSEETESAAEDNAVFFGINF